MAIITDLEFQRMMTVGRRAWFFHEGEPTTATVVEVEQDHCTNEMLYCLRLAGRRIRLREHQVYWERPKFLCQLEAFNAYHTRAG